MAGPSVMPCRRLMMEIAVIATEALASLYYRDLSWSLIVTEMY
jgi:hypothetical protein